MFYCEFLLMDMYFPAEIFILIQIQNLSLLLFFLNVKRVSKGEECIRLT